MKIINQIPVAEDKTLGSTFIRGKEAHVCYVCGRISDKRRTRNGKVMCSKHYKQEWRHGKILDENPRTANDPNEIRINGTVAEMDIYDKLGNIVATAIIDSDDVPRVAPIKWCLGTRNYVITNRDLLGNRNNLHHVVLGLPAGESIDHINHNPLDNRKENLRTVTHAQNAHNFKKTPKGYRLMPSGKYLVSIRHQNNQIHLGSYDTETEAIFARQYAEQLLRGSFTYERTTVDLEPRTANKIRQFVLKQVSKYIDILGTGQQPELAWDNPNRARPICNRDVKTPVKS
jgi:hypothetical protein